MGDDASCEGRPLDTPLSTAAVRTNESSERGVVASWDNVFDRVLRLNPHKKWELWWCSRRVLQVPTQRVLSSVISLFPTLSPVLAAGALGFMSHVLQNVHT